MAAPPASRKRSRRSRPGRAEGSQGGGVGSDSEPSVVSVAGPEEAIASTSQLPLGSHTLVKASSKKARKQRRPSAGGEEAPKADGQKVEQATRHSGPLSLPSNGLSGANSPSRPSRASQVNLNATYSTPDEASTSTSAQPQSSRGVKNGLLSHFGGLRSAMRERDMRSKQRATDDPDQNTPLSQELQSEQAARLKAMEAQVVELQNKLSALERSNKAKDELIENQRSSLSYIFDQASCTICLELAWRPQALSPCGHVFCARCLVDWFKKATSEEPTFPPHMTEQERRDSEEAMTLARTKVCPSCRAVVNAAPGEVWMLKGIINRLSDAQSLGQITLNGQTEIPHRSVEEERTLRGHDLPSGSDMWIGIFDPDGPRKAIWVPADGLYRCGSCTAEIAGGECTECGQLYPEVMDEYDDYSDDYSEGELAALAAAGVPFESEDEDEGNVSDLIDDREEAGLYDDEGDWTESEGDEDLDPRNVEYIRADLGGSSGRRYGYSDDDEDSYDSGDEDEDCEGDEDENVAYGSQGEEENRGRPSSRPHRIHVIHDSEDEDGSIHNSADEADASLDSPIAPPIRRGQGGGRRLGDGRRTVVTIGDSEEESSEAEGEDEDEGGRAQTVSDSEGDNSVHHGLAGQWHSEVGDEDEEDAEEEDDGSGSGSEREHDDDDDDDDDEDEDDSPDGESDDDGY